MWFWYSQGFPISHKMPPFTSQAIKSFKKMPYRTKREGKKAQLYRLCDNTYMNSYEVLQTINLLCWCLLTRQVQLDLPFWSGHLNLLLGMWTKCFHRKQNWCIPSSQTITTACQRNLGVESCQKLISAVREGWLTWMASLDNEHQEMKCCLWVKTSSSCHLILHYGLKISSCCLKTVVVNLL